jgi:hypothetical protein
VGSSAGCSRKNKIQRKRQAFLLPQAAQAQQLLLFSGDVTDSAFSMEDFKRQAYHELFVDRIARFLPVGLSFNKNLMLVENMLNLAVKAANVPDR